MEDAIEELLPGLLHQLCGRNSHVSSPVIIAGLATKNAKDIASGIHQRAGLSAQTLIWLWTESNELTHRCPPLASQGFAALPQMNMLGLQVQILPRAHGCPSSQLKKPRGEMENESQWG
jgi:hypothetical protein